jgi:hypothetical protein
MGCIRIYATSHRIQLDIFERAIFERAVTEVRSVVSLAHDFLHETGTDHPIAGAATLAHIPRRPL